MRATKEVLSFECMVCECKETPVLYPRCDVTLTDQVVQATLLHGFFLVSAASRPPGFGSIDTTPPCIGPLSP